MDYPLYLRDAPLSGRTYGTLSYNRRRKAWSIKGEPCVVDLAARLFPGAVNRKGVVTFIAHRRAAGDINWLMMRYPLEIEPRDISLWERSLEEAREFILRREEVRSLTRTAPPESYFRGKLLAYQEQGLTYLLTMRRCLLADEMGLGKTVQALAFLAASNAYPALIVVPPHLTRAWGREIERFLGEGVRVHTIKGLTPYELPEADIYLIHYLLLRGWKDVLPEMGFNTVIFDEIQELRHDGTGKYSAASLISSSAANCIGLSGTPIYNNGGEIWNVINIIDFHFLGDRESFTRQWCTGYNLDIVAKPEELGRYLRDEGIMLRRLKKDVLSELSPKRRLVQEIDWDDAVYRRFMLPVAEKLRLLRGETDRFRRSAIEDEICARERQATGIAKAQYVCEFVRALLDAGEKVLLMGHHHAVMDIYREELKKYRPRFITGRETTLQKDAAAAEFMEGKTDLLVISLRSASGMNLQRATCVVFGELDWSPAVHSQAEDRAHRIGQKDSLLCYYLVSPRGSDRDMQDALGLKVSQFVELMGDSRPDVEDELLLQSQARERIERLVTRLDGEYPS